MQRIILILLCALALPLAAAPLTIVTNIDLQPLAAQAQRVADVLNYLGAPLSALDAKDLREAGSRPSAARSLIRRSATSCATTVSTRASASPG